MNCSKCGAPLPETTTFCPYCGAASDRAQPQNVENGPQPYYPAQSPDWQQNNYQPPSPYQGYAPPPPPGGAPSFVLHLVLSILMTLFCCLPLGIPAIVFAAMINSRIQEQNYEAAQKAARSCRICLWIGLGLGILTIILSLLLGLFSFNSMSNFYYDY